MGGQVDRAARRDLITKAALELLIDHPRSEVTFELIADRARLRFWQVYHSYGNAGNLYRAATTRLIRRIEADLQSAPTTAESVHQACRIYAEFTAQIIQQETYFQLVYLLIRDGCGEPMLRQVYELQVAKQLRAGLEKIVGNAGAARGLLILLPPTLSFEFVKTLEAELVLPKLLPDYEAPSTEALNAVVKRVADRALSASYALEPQAA